MNVELINALDQLEDEKHIDKGIIFEAIENALVAAAKNNNRDAEDVTATVDRETGDYHVYYVKTVVDEEDLLNPYAEITKEDAQKIDGSLDIGDTVNIEIDSTKFGRIATGAAKSTIIQAIRTEEKHNITNEYNAKLHKVVTGVVQRKNQKTGTVIVNLGTADAAMPINEQVKGERYNQKDRIKVAVTKVSDGKNGTKIEVSRASSDLVRGLFTEEVTEISDGTVEIKGIAREAGSRTKIAVWSYDEDVDPVGSCVGMNGSRVNAVVDELNGEKIDIINWSDTPAFLIENALSPAKVISVIADSEERTAKVVVPDFQLSLAIGREGQNARLAAKLTGYKIDIKSETQAVESGDFPPYDENGEEETVPEGLEDFEGQNYYDENGQFIGNTDES